MLEIRNWSICSNSCKTCMYIFFNTLWTNSGNDRRFIEFTRKKCFVYILRTSEIPVQLQWKICPHSSVFYLSWIYLNLFSVSNNRHLFLEEYTNENVTFQTTSKAPVSIIVFYVVQRLLYFYTCKHKHWSTDKCNIPILKRMRKNLGAFYKLNELKFFFRKSVLDVCRRSLKWHFMKHCHKKSFYGSCHLQLMWISIAVSKWLIMH